MFPALFKFLAKATSLVSWLIQRKAAKNDNPETKTLKYNKQVQNEVIHDDADAANARLSESLARLRVRNAKNASGGTGSGSPKS